ncbi:hypothetical protein OQA88_11874 [Cercophora sp. LCS_1]
MAKFTAILLATVALVAGVRAACPPSGFFCGSELVDVHKCITYEELRRITPPFDEVTTDIYPTTETGFVGIPSTSCKATGCRNSNLQVSPPQYARCF